MMKVLPRKPIAWVAIVGVLFAQMAMTAYAFDAMAGSAAAGIAAPSAAPVDAGGGHCTGLAPDPAPANVCEVHCTDGAASPSAPDMPPVSLTALPVDLAPFAPLGAQLERARSSVAALPGAPPPSLRYCRLLI